MRAQKAEEEEETQQRETIATFAALLRGLLRPGELYEFVVCAVNAVGRFKNFT